MKVAASMSSRAQGPHHALGATSSRPRRVTSGSQPNPPSIRTTRTKPKHPGAMTKFELPIHGSPSPLGLGDCTRPHCVSGPQ